MLQPLIKKELRLAGAPIVATLCMAIVMVVAADIAPHESWNPVITWLVMGVVCSYLITSLFGSEVSLQCFEWGRSMPWSKHQFWKHKISVSICLYASMAILFIGASYVFHKPSGPENSPLFAFAFVGSFASMAWACLGPGIYLTLKSRNLTASMWLTCLLPVILCAGFLLCLGFLSVAAQHVAIAGFILALIYGAIGLWLAKKAFLNWEDGGVHFTELALPGRLSKTPSQPDFKIGYRPIWYLLKRELRLQKVNIGFGMALWLVGCAAITMNKWMNMQSILGIESARVFEFVPSMIRYLLLMVPCMMACVAVAESRRFGVWESELVQPIRRSTQFWMKFWLTLGMSWVVAGVLGIPLDLWIFRHDAAPNIYIILFLHVISWLVFVFSFYAASLSRGFLKALTSCFVVIPAMCLFWRIGYREVYPRFEVSLFFAAVLMIPFLVWRIRKNVEVAAASYSLKRQNALQTLIAGVIILCVAWILRDRSWERVTLQEPEMGESILKEQVQPGISIGNYFYPVLLSPDGQVYSIPIEIPDYRSMQTMKVFKPVRLPLQSPTGVWVDSAFEAGHRFVLDEERKLWTWSLREELQLDGDGGALTLQSVMPEKSWSVISAGSAGFLGVATDGTLWTGGIESKNRPVLAQIPNLAQVDALIPSRWQAPSDPDQNAYDPIIEPQNDWKDCLVFQDMMFALREDGRLFAWGNTGKSYYWNRLFLSRQFMKHIYPNHGKFVEISGADNSKLILTTSDRSQWISAKDANGLTKLTPSIQHQALMRIMPKHDANGNLVKYTSYDGSVLRRSDGTLWRVVGSRISDQRISAPFNRYGVGEVDLPVQQMGKRDDWVARSGKFGMTADGKIWNWDLSYSQRDWRPIIPRFRHKVVADLDP